MQRTYHKPKSGKIGEPSTARTGQDNFSLRWRDKEKDGLSDEEADIRNLSAATTNNEGTLSRKIKIPGTNLFIRWNIFDQNRYRYIIFFCLVVLSIYKYFTPHIVGLLLNGIFFLTIIKR
jgi:hypothetical protein